MIGEPQRSQYLEAMGLTAWVSRYRLPNAAPTLQCEWLEPETPLIQPPAQRLQALLGQASREEAPLKGGQEQPVSSPAASTSSALSPALPPRHARRARALLGDSNDDGDEVIESSAKPSSGGVPTDAANAVNQATQSSLRFSLQIAALDGRWLVMLPGRASVAGLARNLLNNLLQAAHITPGTALDFQAFDWPMMEGLPVETPLEEAQDGLRAFVEGRRRRGWRPERLLIFGQDDTLNTVLDLQGRYCRLLDVPGWQGPSLQSLSQSVDEKRALWPLLIEWRQAWHEAAQGAQGGDDAAT
ncbi:hypothetical protein ACPF7Z_05325 [Halomonas sp. GXIMD04776]|uniref:hypothetical protein n=1 Tax=Halomonas sp. GXIMD04776 TaxID=3415605 RepID=UPI003C895C02